MIGSRVGEYEIVNKIGEGGMATVYRAWEPRLERYVAVKFIKPQIAADPSALDAFRQEVRLLVTLAHPHLLPIYSYDDSYQPPYFVMRYLESGTLRDAIAQLDGGILGYDETLHMLVQVARALDFVHRSGIIHRDIKPSNIMLDTDGNAFLADFGIARLAKRAPRPDVGQTTNPDDFSWGVMGTPAYAAPEQIFARETMTRRADLYSLGVVTFWMLTGRLPYEGDNIPQMLEMHRSLPPPRASSLNPQLSGEVDAVLQKVLAKRPPDRYGTASDFVAALGGALGLTAAAEPLRLRQSAQSIAEETQFRLEAQRDEIDKTMADFAASRSSVEMSAPVPLVPDAPTVRESGDIAPSEASGDGANALLPDAAKRQPLLSGTLDSGGSAPHNESGASGSAPPPGPGKRSGRRPPQRWLWAVLLVALVLIVLLVVVAPSITGLLTPTLSPRNLSATAFVSGRLTEDADKTAAVAQILTDTASAPTATSTPTATFTDTPSPTPTQTATFTDTPSPTPTATFTDTPSPTPTATFTDTPSPTPTATFTDTPSPTPTATFTDTPSPTPTATPLPTPTPLPGSLPFVSRLEAADGLAGWRYDPRAWSVSIEGGVGVLVGRGRLDQPLVVLGDDNPQWLRESDMLIRFRMNLSDANAGGRVLLRCPDAGSTPCQGGYNVLEFFPGVLFFRRSGSAPNLADRQSETIIRRVDLPTQANTWFDVDVWLNGARVYVYVNRALVLREQDLALPQQTLGQIVFQTLSGAAPVRWEGLIVQAVNPVSAHFESAAPPAAWRVEAGDRVSLRSETPNDQVLRLEGPNTLTLDTPPLRDLELSCRFRLNRGEAALLLRDSPEGRMQLLFQGSRVFVQNIDNAGNIVFNSELLGFYRDTRWSDFRIVYVDERLMVIAAGDERLNLTLTDLPPPAGRIQFVVQEGAQLDLDACLLVNPILTRQSAASLALELKDSLSGRPFEAGVRDLAEGFDSADRLAALWSGGGEASLETDPQAVIHPTFLRLRGALDASAYRLLSQSALPEVLLAGDDIRTFSDSANYDVTVEVRLPQEAGSAWLLLRAVETGEPGRLSGYRFTYRRGSDGSAEVQIWQVIAGEAELLASEALGSPAPEWLLLNAVSFKDEVAFFANGVFIHTQEDARLLGGSVALGADADTWADFDSLVIRDTN